MLINTMALVTVNMLQLTLHSKVIPWFPTELTISSNKENNNIEGKKQQESTNKAKGTETNSVNQMKNEWVIPKKV